MANPVGSQIERVTGYKTLVKHSIVNAIRSVFDNEYPDRQLRNINVNTEYPLALQDFPAIIIRYHEDLVTNAGVGHQELLYDRYGALRSFQHSRFEGSIEFVILGETSYDVDIVSDALIDMIRHGSLSLITSSFFTGVYSEAAIEGSQVILNTDMVYGRGDSSTMTGWLSEDARIYEAGYTVPIHGAFYSSDPEGQLMFIREVTVYPYMDGDEKPNPAPLDVKWNDITDYEDNGEVNGLSTILGN